MDYQMSIWLCFLSLISFSFINMILFSFVGICLIKYLRCNFFVLVPFEIFTIVKNYFAIDGFWQFLKVGVQSLLEVVVVCSDGFYVFWGWWKKSFFFIKKPWSKSSFFHYGVFSTYIDGCSLSVLANHRSRWLIGCLNGYFHFLQSFKFTFWYS